MTNDEKMALEMALDRHSEALEAHTRALNSLTAMLSGIFEEDIPLTHDTKVYPLHRTLNAFIEHVEQITSKNHLIAEANSDVAEKLKRASSVNYEAADKMMRAASINDEAAEKMSRAARRY